MIKKLLMLILILVLLVSLGGCVPNDGTNTGRNLAGFFWGVWHGWIAPVSLIMGFFNKTTRIYETANNGLLYDLGFYIAIISGFGGVSLFRRRRND